MSAHDPRPPGDGEREQRTFERVRMPANLRGEVMVFQPLTIIGLSRGGAEIETTHPLQLDSLHDVRLTLGENSVVLKGRVAHCRISDVELEQVRYRSGLEFVEPSERVEAVITGFLERLGDA
jgi:hypothetical protein